MSNSISSVNKKLLCFLAVFIVLGGLVGWLYKVGVNRPPLRYAYVPQSTKDFINSIGKKGDNGLTYNDQGPFDWDEDENLGEKEWAKEYDANFVVYYHKDMKAQWQLYAQQVLQQANENILSLTDLMGKYYYPSDMNGRKLAVYLPETAELYGKTVSELMNGNGNGSGSLGVTVTEIGPFGCLTKGIVLHPSVFSDTPNGLNGYVKVLKHEMNHYVFFSSLDYSKEIEHYMWVSEGIAEYYCERHGRNQVSSPDSIDYIKKNCLLNGEFPLTGNTSYWAGESFYLYLESQGGDKKIKDFLTTVYTTSTDSVFVKQKTSANAVHKKWVNYLASGVGRVTPSLANPDSLTIPASVENIVTKENVGKALDITSKVAKGTPLGLAAGVASELIKNDVINVP